MTIQNKINEQREMFNGDLLTLGIEIKEYNIDNKTLRTFCEHKKKIMTDNEYLIGYLLHDFIRLNNIKHNHDNSRYYYKFVILEAIEAMTQQQRKEFTDVLNARRELIYNAILKTLEKRKERSFKRGSESK